LRNASVGLEHIECTQLGRLGSAWKPVHIERQCAYTTTSPLADASISDSAC